MNIRVRFQSRSGNTKKIAVAIADAVGVTAETVEAEFDGAADLLFVGGALYAGKPDKALASFLEKLDGGAVKRIAVFSTAASGKTLLEAVKKIVGKNDVAVASTDFQCRGRFLMMHKGRPNAADLTAAAEFAKGIAQE
ncbi:MAG: flavodoxin [Clostridiales bacterium]|jgi:flavodoxin|nr:flavodoxin [Clostridiales bacterium]